MKSTLRSIRSTVLLLASVFALGLLSTSAQAQGPANGVHTQADQTVNAPHSNSGNVPQAPVQRDRTPFGPGEVTNEDQRKRRHAEAALRTLLAQREDDIRRRLANGELEPAILESLGEAPTIETIMAQGDKSQGELLTENADLDAIGRPLVVVPTPEQVRAAGHPPENIDRVIADAKAARDLQIEEADAAAAKRDAAKDGPGAEAVALRQGGGANAASANTFAAAGGADNLSTEAGQKAAADEKANSPAPATGA